MRFNWIDGVVLAAYFVAMLALGLYQARKIKGTGDFFAGGRKFSKFLMMMHALGTGTHADDPVGVVGASYKHGLSGIWYTFAYLFVTPFYWLMAPLFRRSRFFTTADFFEARFGSALGTLYAIWGIIIFAVNMGTLLIGTGWIAETVSLGAVSQTWAIVGMTVVFVAYGTAGGLIATVITESVQGLLIVVMSLMLVPFGIIKVGGFGGLHQTVADPGKFHLTGELELSIWWIVAASVVNLINIVAQPHTMEVCSTGKTEFEGRVGFTYGNFVKRLCAIGWALTGVIMIAVVAKLPDLGVQMNVSREAAFGTAIRALLPAGFTGLMFAAVLAAQMSTLSAFMVAASALLTRNVYRKHINPAATDRSMLRIARYAGLVIVGLGVTFAMLVQGVADALMWFWTLSAFTGVFMWAGVIWRRANATGAWASFAVMLAVWLVVGEPGNAVSRMMGKRAYKPVDTAAITRLDASMRPISRLMVDLVQKRPAIKDGKIADEVKRKDGVMLVGPGKKLGLTVRPMEDADRQALNLVPGRDGSLVQESVTGVVVTEVAKDGAASDPGIKPGDAILNCAELAYPGIYADKNLLHYRLVAFLPAGILALIVGSLLGAPHPKDRLDKFYALISTPVGMEKRLVEQGVDVIYAGASEGHPWEMNHPRAVNVLGFTIALVLAGLLLLLLWGVGQIGA